MKKIIAFSIIILVGSQYCFSQYNLKVGETSVLAEIPDNSQMLLHPYGTATGNTGGMRLFELVANGTNYVGFRAADALASDYLYTLPADYGTSGYMLQTNGSGNLTWSNNIPGSDADYIWNQTAADQAAGFRINGNGLFNGGSVGIGTLTPSTALEVYASAPALTISPSAYTGSYRTILGAQANATGILMFGNNGNNEIRFGNTAAGGAGTIYVNNTANYTAASNGTMAMYFKSDGSVGVGTTSPLGKFDIRVAGSNGAGKIYTGGDNAYPRIYMGGSSAGVAFVINRETTTATMYFGEDADAGGFQLRGAGSTRISSLAGTGNRPVYADATGILTVSGGGPAPTSTSITTASSTYSINYNNAAVELNLNNSAGGAVSTVSVTMTTNGSILVTSNVTAVAGNGAAPSPAPGTGLGVTATCPCTGNIVYFKYPFNNNSPFDPGNVVNPGIFPYWGTATFKIELLESVNAGAYSVVMTGTALCGMQVPDSYLISTNTPNNAGIFGNRYSFPGNVSLSYVKTGATAGNTYNYRLRFTPGGGNKAGGAYYIYDRSLVAVPVKY